MRPLLAAVLASSLVAFAVASAALFAFTVN